MVIKYFTCVEAVGKDRDTVWKLKLDTGFGQTYNFEMSSTGVITHMWNTTAAPAAAQEVWLRVGSATIHVEKRRHRTD